MTVKGDVNFSAFVGTFTHEFLSRFMSSQVSFEIIDNELFMFMKVPVAGKGTLSTATSINMDDFETRDMEETKMDLIEMVNRIVVVTSGDQECETKTQSSSEN